jgi:hypothetical protein
MTHKLIDRPWGPECRFTVARMPDGSHINEVIRIPDMKIEEAELVKLISVALVQIDRIPEPFVDPIMAAVMAREEEIKMFLVSKDLIRSDQSITDVKSKAEYIDIKVG